jgi:hypothetical protein
MGAHDLEQPVLPGARRTAAGCVFTATRPAGRCTTPPAFQVEVSEQELGLASVEVTIANFRARPGIRVRTTPTSGNVRAVPPVDRAGRFPRDGVAFRLVSNSSGPAGEVHARSRLPLSLASFHRSRGPAGLRYNAATGETLRDGLYHGAPQSLARTVDANSTAYTAIVWIGPDAGAQQRTALARMITSLAFRTTSQVK